MNTYERIKKILEHGNKNHTDKLILLPEELYTHIPTKVKPDQVWRSRSFVVQVFNTDPKRLTINKTMVGKNGGWLDKIEWDELQHIKNECGFYNQTAIELYPPASRVINDANMRHLWIVENPEFM